ncbi:MAG: hypothetical protein HRT44_07920 [Bdellovibrionales bacterium]|nr:hypothetical protein [Bdellovibrionales bacterium]
MGCGRGQTRAGIFRLSDASGVGASRKSHWGNRWRYQVMTNIGGHSREWGGDNCGMNYQHVAHSNRHMTDDNPHRRRGRGRTRKSAGCFVTSPDIFEQYTEGYAGNALIYNVDND